MRLIEIKAGEIQLGFTPDECQQLIQALWTYEKPLTDESLSWWHSSTISAMTLATQCANTQLDAVCPPLNKEP